MKILVVSSDPLTTCSLRQPLGRPGASAARGEAGTGRREGQKEKEAEGGKREECRGGRNKRKKKENHSTQDSHVVPHHGTNWAALRLTAQIGRDAVLSESYGRGY